MEDMNRQLGGSSGRLASCMLYKLGRSGEEDEAMVRLNKQRKNKYEVHLKRLNERANKNRKAMTRGHNAKREPGRN